MATLDFRILGPFEVVRENAVVKLPGRKPRGLLACLVVNAGSTVSQDRLIDAVWGEEPPKSAVNTLHTYVSHLRTALEPDRADTESGLLATEATGYRLDVPDDAVDARRLEAAVADGLALLNRGRAKPAAEALERGLRAWRGPALEEFLDADFARPEAARLDELRQVAAVSRAEALLTIGDDATVVSEVEALVIEYPLREGLWRHLMLALHRSGRQADALRAYERYRSELAEIGLEPGDELRGLEDRILMQDPALLAASGAIAGGSGEREIPQPLTTFVGREDELEELTDLLDRTRLITLTGIGGIGKSRLAIEAGRAAATSKTDGGRYIDLAEVTQPELVEPALAGALGIAEAAGRDPLQLIQAELRERSLVLVVDNAEEVAFHTGAVLGAILATAHEVVAVVASRQPLGADGETTYVVGPLTDPVRLFEERAGPTPNGDRELVADICHAVNGIPAAIELVAARTRMLSIEEIAEHIEEVALATDDSRQALPAVLAWTYASLPEAHQQLLRRISLFNGGFTFDALVAVAAPGEDRRLVLSQLGKLIDQALVAVAGGTPSRYSMLDVFRGELGTRLGDDEADLTNAAHARYYAGLADELEASFATERWRTMVQRIDAEDGNLRQALEWAIEAGDFELAARLAGPLGRYWRWRDRAIEGAQWVDAVLAIDNAPRPAKVLREAAGLHRVRGDLEGSVALATEALEAYTSAGDDAGRADALYDLGLAGIFAGDFDTAGGWFAEAAAIWEQLERPALMAFPLIPLAWLRQIRGDYDTAEDLWSTILAGVDTARFPEHSGITFRLADLALDQGQTDRAAEIAAAALAAAVEAGYPYHEAGARSALARLAYYKDDLEPATTEAAAALEAARDSGNVEGIGFALRRLAWVAIRRDDHQLAARYLGQAAAYGGLGGALSVALLAELAAALLTRQGRSVESAGLYAAADQVRLQHRLPLPAPEAEEIEGEVTAVRADLGDQAFESAQEAGRSWQETELWRLIRPGMP